LVGPVVLREARLVWPELADRVEPVVLPVVRAAPVASADLLAARVAPVASADLLAARVDRADSPVSRDRQTQHWVIPNNCWPEWPCWEPKTSWLR